MEKVIILGSGPAGLTAALYNARAQLNPLVLEGHEPGGQLTLTTEVDNFPGFPEGILGPELIANMKAQAKRFGARLVQEHAVEVDLSKRPFKVTTEKQTYLAQALIIATGASARFLGLPHEKELTGRGVSTCATCDGFFYKNRIVHVVGGGDTAMEEAHFLSKFASKVTIIHRKDSLRASKPMQEKTQKNPKIDFLWNSEVQEILFDAQGVTGLKIFNNKTQEVSTRATDGLFYGIGHTPNTQFLGEQIKKTSSGLILTVPGRPETNVAGVFACGDVQDPTYRQAITAAGSGCAAAISAEHFLEAHK